MRLLGEVSDDTVLRLVHLLGGLPDDDVIELIEALSRLSPTAARRATKLMSGVVRTSPADDAHEERPRAMDPGPFRIHATSRQPFACSIHETLPIWPSDRLRSPSMPDSVPSA